MSFAGDVKEQLSRQIPSARHCQLAELRALFDFLNVKEEDKIPQISTENLFVARKCFTLLRKAFKMGTDLTVRRQVQRSYRIRLYGWPEAMSHVLVQNSCCKRAYVRGAFLVAGSVSDPAKGYHFEIVCDTREKALRLQTMMADLQITSRITERKGNFVVYVKEGSQIVELLGLMGAHVALMDFENARIVRHVRNSLNRKVNCEAANLGKTVSAAVKQTEDICLIRDLKGLDTLPAPLREIAEIRLENPDATLKELGQMLEPPVGKSGVNHRLRKLGEMADQLRTG